MKKVVLLSAFAFLVLSTAGWAQHFGDLEALATPAAPPALPNSVDRAICLEDDNFDHASSDTGTWTLEVGQGSISGSVQYNTCSYTVSGSYFRADVTMNLVSTGGTCCESASVTAVVNKPARVAEGTIGWLCTGSTIPGATTWTLCP